MECLPEQRQPGDTGAPRQYGDWATSSQWTGGRLMLIGEWIERTKPPDNADRGQFMSRYSFSSASNAAVLPWQGTAILLLSILFCVGIPRALVAADSSAAHSNLPPTQIVDKHVAAHAGP